MDQDFRQWQALSAKLAARQSAHGDRILGAPEIGSFHADRSKLLESVGREAQRVVQTYDRGRESAAIADGARTAVAATAAVGAGALGLGTVVTVAATTAAMDVTGMLAAGVIGAVGLLIIPAKRRRARVELREKVSNLRVRLAEACRRSFRRRASVAAAVSTTVWRHTRASCEASSTGGGRRGRRWRVAWAGGWLPRTRMTC